MAIGLFRGSFTKTVPVTVISDRAGLVMNPDAKVKMRGVQVGKVDVDREPARRHGGAAPGDGSVAAASHPVQRRTSTSHRRRCSAPSSSSWSPPDDPSPQKLRAGQVIQSQHVMVEINTVFQQLVQVLDKIDPAKLNETLGAISKAFNGRGEKIGKTLTDFNAFLAKIEPSLPNLSHDIEAAVPTLQRVRRCGARPRSRPSQTPTQISNTIVDEQQNLDAVLGQLNRSGRHRQRRDRRQPARR